MSIQAVQARLTALGYSPGPADGIMGKNTMAALQAYAWDRLVSELPSAKIDPRAIALIKEFEGFEASAYTDPVGIVTIGYGTTAAADVGIVPKLGMTISEAEAETYLMRAVSKFADVIRPTITAPITPSQFGAFVSLAYNIGPSAFMSSSALRLFNAGDEQGAANAILKWNRGGDKVLKGLVRRREAERMLFLS